jgi:hypothetical protein
MGMEIRFETKEDSNRRRQEEFLKLSGHERFMRFLKLSLIIQQNFPTKAKSDKSSNFIIDMTVKKP